MTLLQLGYEPRIYRTLLRLCRGLRIYVVHCYIFVVDVIGHCYNLVMNLEYVVHCYIFVVDVIGHCYNLVINLEYIGHCYIFVMDLGYM